MPVKIKEVEAGTLAEALGWQIGDEIVAINGHPIADVIDFRFHATEERLEVKLRRDLVLRDLVVEKEAYASLGVELEEFRIRTCGDNCVFCFVDQNPAGLRETLYVRDSDFRMSFLYGNYITVTNLRQRDLERIVEQRLSPMYISVHATNPEARRRMMGHTTQNDRLMEKLQFFRENGIEMHTQVVLVPGFNDGAVLVDTIADLFALHDTLLTVSIVPVGLTRHRDRLTALRGVASEEARGLIRQVHLWQDQFKRHIGRGFVYLSDEMYLLAGVDFPGEDAYDGFPLIENGVGMCRDFLNEFDFQRAGFPEALPAPRRITMATGALAAPFLRERILPSLRRIRGLEVDLVEIENTLFGPPVTVSGLLSYRCFYEALKDRGPMDLVLLPPDCLNFEGLFLDNRSPDQLADALSAPVKIFSGDWSEAIGDFGF